MIDSFLKSSMMLEFDMSDLGMSHYFLGIEIVQSVEGIFISQKKYVREISDRFQCAIATLSLHLQMLAGSLQRILEERGSMALFSNKLWEV